MALCEAGRIYEIERWIRGVKPIQAKTYKVHRRGWLQSPIEIAISKGLLDVALLLLCNGYRLDLESPLTSGPLDQALERRSWAFVDLLLEWGADPRSVYPESVFATYRLDLFDRFWNAGLDFVKDHALAGYLAEHSSNRPLYGWAKRNRADPRISREIDIGLLHAVHEKRAKIVQLLLWAGANPRASVPMLAWNYGGDEDDCYVAMEEAASAERDSVLPLLKPDPTRDNFDALYAVADSVEVLTYLLAKAPPTDWTPTILRHLRRLGWAWTEADHKGCLDFIAERGGRLGQLTPEECAEVRGCILKLGTSDAESVLRWLGDPESCDPATFSEITRTSTMRGRLRKMKKDEEEKRRRW